ncbi:MAG: 2-C-methyl-D-erythritol 2,4-cyclodiphosphate synthase [Gemmatimonadota bacterium]|nr:2-C-methyl-D-erythritol 2,4-cyclodiphosphate synthase [Gemmatimonadota bacterium]
MRVGFGYDSHRFDPDRPLVLGGVRIADAPGLAGHSDADAIAHAVTDAVLGAAALGDIGRHFPPGDPAWKDADSIDLLRRAVALLHDRGYAVGNVDVTVVTERVRIAPHADAMRTVLATTLGVAVDAVSVKGKTNEGMGWTGEGVGLAAYAVALVRPT